MAHEYEYAVMVDFMPPKETDESVRFTDEPVRIAFGNAFRELAGKLPSAINSTIGEGWWINSHSVTFQDGVPIITILLQKRRK